MWPAPCDFPTFVSIVANWYATFVQFGRPQRPPIVNRVICQSTWPAVHWLHWSMLVATMTIDATVFLLDFVSNGVVALRYGMNRRLFYFHLHVCQLKKETKKKIHKKYDVYDRAFVHRWISPAVMRKSSILETCKAVTGPGFGGNDRIKRPECISNISARVSSHPIIARWLSIAIVMARTYARTHNPNTHKSINCLHKNVIFAFMRVCLHFVYMAIVHMHERIVRSQHEK